MRKLTTICSPIPVVEEKPLQLSQKSVIVLGRAKYDNQSNLHTLCEYMERGREREKERATICTVLYCNLTKRGAYCICVYAEGERERWEERGHLLYPSLCII